MKKVTFAILAHVDAGKTTLSETMLYHAGVIKKIGRVDKADSFLDYDQQERKRGITIFSKEISFSYQNSQMTFLDTPGHNDFSCEMERTLQVLDYAVLVISAKDGIQGHTKTIWKLLQTYQIPTFIFVNKMDCTYSTKEQLIQDIQNELNENCFLLDDHFLENVSLVNDELLEKYINEEPFTKEEISWALRQGVMNQTLIPVLCGTSQIGIQILLNSMVAFFPAAGDTCNSIIVENIDTHEEDIIGFNESLPPSLFIFKTIVDPFVGRESLFKVCTGHIQIGMSLLNVDKNEVEKVNKLYIKRGKELIEVDELCAGDIGCMTKLSHSLTNDTLCTLDYRMKYQPIHFSKPYYGKAVKPIGKANEEKIASGIARLLEEDPTLKFESNHETKQQCLYGIGDIHLESIVSKLKSKFKIDVKLEDMKVSYRESIRKSYTQRTKFKKQSGGHGQYGEVEILFEPTKDYNQSYVFKEKVFGGAVPKAYFPAVEKGLIESVKEGVIGHYPVLGIQATLLDGSYHSVDSSEQAFKTATMMCFKDAMKHLEPCLLEPYVILNIYIDEEYLGDLMSYVNKKRGKVLETDSLDDGLMKLVCRIPQVEILEFAIDLRSMTQGQGIYNYHFDGYEIVNDDLVERLLKK